MSRFPHAMIRIADLQRNVDFSTKASVEELLAIAKRAASHVERPCVEHAQLLYDENGLPK